MPCFTLMCERDVGSDLLVVLWLFFFFFFSFFCAKMPGLSFWFELVLPGGHVPPTGRGRSLEGALLLGSGQPLSLRWV